MIRRIVRGWLLPALLWGLAAPLAGAQPYFVQTSNTDHAYIAKHIGGDLVETYTPHKGYMEPELTWVDEIFPSWIIRARRADVYIRYGFNADVWADTVIEAARNPRIRFGAIGYLDPTEKIEVLEIPTQHVDRRLGDLHVFGNPHFLLDPANAILVARSVAARFQTIWPEHANTFETNLQDFLSRLESKMKEWETRAAPLRGKNIASHHRTWSYFAKRFGLNVVGVVEPKPGIEPTPRDLDVLISAMKANPTPVIIRAPVYSEKWSLYAAERVGYPVKIRVLGAHVGAEESIRTYFDLFDYLIDNLLDLYDLR